MNLRGLRIVTRERWDEAVRDDARERGVSTPDRRARASVAFQALGVVVILGPLSALCLFGPLLLAPLMLGTRLGTPWDLLIFAVTFWGLGVVGLFVLEHEDWVYPIIGISWIGGIGLAIGIGVVTR